MNLRLAAPAVFRLFPIDDAAPEDSERAVQAWLARHAGDYMLDKPVLVTLNGKTYVWCYGQAGSFVVEQAEVMQRVRAQAGGSNIAVASAGPRLAP